MVVRSPAGLFGLSGLVVCGTLTITIGGALAEGRAPAPGEAWRQSPFHGVTNGATGMPIPCVCRYRGRDFRLGEAVCMQTPMGVFIVKCDLKLNNTTWAPTDEPCALSGMQRRNQYATLPSKI